ncbi:MAG: YSC84-related protein [Chitinophagaceae bacterium]
MKTVNIFRISVAVIFVLLLHFGLYAQNGDKVITESRTAKSTFLKKDESMQKFFKEAYAYVIFPHIGKGAVVVGGAGGDGAVFEKGKAIGKAKIGQVTVGAQVGGQSYREVIFFEDKAALDRFKENKLEFSGQLSAVAAKSGASLNAKYREGVAVFTDTNGGLMAEASVGGQKFTYKSL